MYLKYVGYHVGSHFPAVVIPHRTKFPEEKISWYDVLNDYNAEYSTDLLFLLLVWRQCRPSMRLVMAAR